MTYSASSTQSGLQFLLRGGSSAAFDPSQIKVGDEIGVSGVVSPSAPTTIAAQILRNYSISVPRSADPRPQQNGYGQIGLPSFLERFFGQSGPLRLR